MIKAINGKGPEQFKIGEEDARLPLMAIGGLIFQLLMIIAISTVFKFYLKKGQAIVQI